MKKPQYCSYEKVCPFFQEKGLKKPWANSIVFENRIIHCVECNMLILRNKTFRIRKDNGMVVAFCSEDHEKKYDKHYLNIGKH